MDIIVNKGDTSEAPYFSCSFYPMKTGYVSLDVRFDRVLNWFELRRLEGSIESRGGKITDKGKFTNKPPRGSLLSKEDRKTIINGTILAALAFFSTLGGSRGVASLDISQFLIIAGIPAAVAFLTKIAQDRGILSGSKRGNDHK